MDTNDIATMRTELRQFLRRFQSCSADKRTRNDFRLYVSGLISHLPRKNCEAIALQAGVSVRSVQWFLSRQAWDHERMRNKIQKIVAREHAAGKFGGHSIGIIDETSFVKKGTKTPGVQRQYCGTVGKQENCIVTVHLAYAVDNFHTLIDQDLFLPESWDEDRDRCRAAGNGIVFEWVTFDEGYGGKPEFLRQLDAKKQLYIGEIPCAFYAWTHLPKTTMKSEKQEASTTERGNDSRIIEAEGNPGCIPERY